MAKIVVLDVAGTKLLYLDVAGTKQAAVSDTFFWVDDDVDGLFNNANNWSSSSGGAGGLGVPSLQDKIVFDGGNVTNCRLNLAMTVGEIDMKAAYTGTIDGATDNLSHAITGDVTLDGTRFDMGNGTWTVSGNFDNKDVTTFNRNSSTLVMDGTAKKLITGGTKDLTNLTIDGAITLDPLTDTFADIRGLLTINVGKTFTIAKAIVARGGATVNGTLTTNAGIITTFSMGVTIGVSGVMTGDGTTEVGNGHPIINNNEWSIATTRVRVFQGSMTLNGGTYGGNWTLQDHTASIFDTSLIMVGTVIFTGNVICSSENAGITFTIDMATNNASVEFQGDLTLQEIAGTLAWAKGTGTITYSGGATQTVATLDRSLEDYIVNKSGGSLVFSGNQTSDSFTLTLGTVDNSVNDPTLNLSGDFLITAGTYTRGTGMLKFIATSGTVNVTSAGQSLESVAQDGPGSTLNFVDNLTAVGVSACQGVIDYNAKTFTLSGTLLIDGSTGATVDLAGLAGSTFTANAATFTGTSIAARLDLKALADWFLTLTTEGVATFVDVSHSDASGGNRVNAMESINSLNNQNWFFGASPGISGRTRYAEPWDRPSLRLYKRSLH